MEIFTFRQGFFILKRCWLSNFHERMDPLYGSSAQGVFSMSLLIIESRDLWVCDLNIIFYSLNIDRQSTFPLCNKRTGTWCTTINLFQIFFSVAQHFYSRKTTHSIRSFLFLITVWAEHSKSLFLCLECFAIFDGQKLHFLNIISGLFLGAWKILSQFKICTERSDSVIDVL